MIRGLLGAAAVVLCAAGVWLCRVGADDDGQLRKRQHNIAQ
ncbi:hypothetical protein RBA12_05815 [Mycobacteroides abscessus subsp. massiliense]